MNRYYQLKAGLAALFRESQVFRDTMELQKQHSVSHNYNYNLYITAQLIKQSVKQTDRTNFNQSEGLEQLCCQLEGL